MRIRVKQHFAQTAALPGTAPGSITDLNERDKKLFDYACFIDVNKFWSGFEDIRDINHEKWPMLIDAGNLNEYPDFHRLLAKSKSLGKQLVIMNRQKGKDAKV